MSHSLILIIPSSRVRPRPFSLPAPLGCHLPHGSAGCAPRSHPESPLRGRPGGQGRPVHSWSLLGDLGPPGMGHSDPGLSQPLQDLSWGVSQQAPSSSRVSSSCLCLSQRRGMKNPLESCLLCPSLAVSAAFSSHPQHCKHYPHCRTRERGSRVAELTPDLSAHGSARPGYVARSPGATAGLGLFPSLTSSKLSPGLSLAGPKPRVDSFILFGLNQAGTTPSGLPVSCGRRVRNQVRNRLCTNMSSLVATA